MLPSAHGGILPSLLQRPSTWRSTTSSVGPQVEPGGWVAFTWCSPGLTWHLSGKKVDFGLAVMAQKCYFFTTFGHFFTRWTPGEPYWMSGIHVMSMWYSLEFPPEHHMNATHIPGRQSASIEVGFIWHSCGHHTAMSWTIYYFVVLIWFYLILLYFLWFSMIF